MKRSINYIIILLVAFLVAFPTVGNAMKKKKKNSNQTRSPWSLEVAFDVNDENSRAEKVRLSVKYQLNQNSAWRLGLGFVQDDFNDDFDRSFDSDGYHYEITTPRYSRMEGVELSAQYLIYPVVNRNLKMYWGVGPRFSAYDSDRSLLLLYDYDPALYDVEILDAYDFTRVGAGVETSLGLEWFIGNKFSLLGEWSLSFGQQWLTYETEFVDPRGHGIKEDVWISNGVHSYDPQFRIGAALHF